MEVIIMRGLPGSGKSTWAKRYRDLAGTRQHVEVLSADDGHLVEGVYRFDPKKVRQAHDDCFRNFVAAIEHEMADTIIVDNTGTAAWELSPYYRFAEINGCNVRIVRMHCDFETSCRQNIHDVPRETIWRMHQTLLTERLPAHWREEIILPNECS